MPKRISKRPSDINQAAFLMVERSTAETEPKKPRQKVPPEVSRVMSAMGRKGGRIGGKISSANMTPEKRKERALQAARARWAKRQK